MKKPKGKTIPAKKGPPKERPSFLRGNLKQTEGYTPKEAMATGKQAGVLNRAAKRREKKLANIPM